MVPRQIAAHHAQWQAIKRYATALGQCRRRRSSSYNEYIFLIIINSQETAVNYKNNNHIFPACTNTHIKESAVRRAIHMHMHT